MRTGMILVASVLGLTTAAPTAMAKTVACSKRDKSLGTISGRDDANGSTYSFAICHDTKKDEVRIHAYPVTGTYVNPSNLPNILKKARGGKIIRWGSPYNPGRKDARRVEYRVYLDDHDKPIKLEIYLVMLKADETAKEPKSLIVDLPPIF